MQNEIIDTNAAQTEETATPNTRRAFLGKLGLIGAGTLLASSVPAQAQMSRSRRTDYRKNQDVDILNFALNLEYLEAAFYLAAVGRLNELTAVGGVLSRISLPASSADFNPLSGGITSLSPAARAYADEIATDELNHVDAIRTALGKSAVRQPTLDLNGAFDAAGQAASKGAIKGFNPFANELFFLHGAFIFEDVGVTAYKGAARLLIDVRSGGALETAAGILAVEAYHAGIIRTLLYQQKDVVAAAGLTVAQIVGAISDLRDSVDGSSDMDQGIVTKAGKANLSPTNSKSIAYSRTVRQVLNIVYLGVDTAKGGFFPNGLNGTFTK